MNVERRALSGLKWVALAKLLGQAVSWALTLLTMRLLLPQDYGLMAIVAVVIIVLGNVAELGIGVSVIQSREISRDDLKKISGLVTLVSLGIYAALWFSAPLISAVYEMERLTHLIQVAGLQFLISAVAVLPLALAQRNLEFKRLAGIDFAKVITASVSTLALAWHGFGVWSLVLGSLAGRLVMTVLLASRGIVWPSFRLAGVRKFLALGGAVTFGRLTWQIVYQSDVLIGARRLGAADIGAYSVGLQLATMPMDRIMGILNQVTLPTVARLQDERERLSARLQEGCRLLTAFSVPALWGISSVSPELIAVVLGEKWLPAVFPLQVISLIIPLRMISVVFATAGTGIGHAGLVFRNSLVTALVLPSAFYAGTYWGINGLAAAWLFAIPIVLSLNLPGFARALAVPLAGLGRAIWRPFAAGFAMYLAVVMCRSLLAEASDLVTLSVLIAAGAVAYTGALHALDRSLLGDLFRLMRAARA